MPNTFAQKHIDMDQIEVRGGSKDLRIFRAFTKPAEVTRQSRGCNGYLRTLFMQAARVILLRRASWPKHGFGIWLAHAAQRLHPNVLAAALANKLARIAWTVLAQQRGYEARITKAAA